jgi:pimeloyl-ACP methyl ester carboxylesterase
VPTLIAGGRNDPLIPIAATAAIQAGIADSRLLVLENSGHGAEGDDEESFRDAVRRLLARV